MDFSRIKFYICLGAQDLSGMVQDYCYPLITIFCKKRIVNDLKFSDPHHRTYASTSLTSSTRDVFNGLKLLLTVKYVIFVVAMTTVFSFRKVALPLILLFSIFLGSDAFGQYGPMGFGNADGSESPAGYAQPKLLLWLDGSSVTVSNGGNVTTWPDKSGNGHNFIADAAWAPIFRTSGGPGGLPYVEFSRADTRMFCENFPMSDEGYTIYFVIRSNDSKYGIFNYGSSADPQELVVYNDDANGFIRQQIGSELRTTAIGDISNDTWLYGGIVHDIGSLIWEYNRSNEAGAESNSSFAQNETFAPTGTAVIGNIQQTLNGGFLAADALDGDIAEIIIWEGALSRPHTRLMRTYLWTKYGVSNWVTGAGWDKFQGFANGSGGEYDEPIALGRDNGNPNAGEHCESRLKGLVLRVNPGQWTQSRTYLCAGHIGATNSIVTTDLPAGVQARWSRVWEIGASNDGTGQQYRVGFDFGEGVGGEFPQVVDNFVLLRRTGNTGTFLEVPANQIVEKAIVDDEVVFTIVKSNIDDANQFYTIGTKDVVVSTLDGTLSRTWYAYQTGDWNNPLTWTLDGSAAPAYVNPDNVIPATGDNVVIGSGRNVLVNISGVNQGNLQLFGTLDVGTQPSPSFAAISGNGTIKCAGFGSLSNFPIGNSAEFADQDNGGRVEFYGSGSNLTQTSDLLVNRMEINFASSTRQLILASTNVVSNSTNDLTHNGLLEITSGTLVLNNGATTVTRNINSIGDIFIAAQGNIRVDVANRSHRWNVQGNIFNDGDVRLTQRTAPDYSNPDAQGRVALRFIDDDKNQNLTTNGNFNVWRLVVDKGLDKTYKVEISANAPNKFNVFGECEDGGANDDYENESQNLNAVAIINGTCHIRENVFLPLQVGNGGNYNINHTAALWVDGGTAAKGAPLVGPGNSQAIVVYGELIITAGALHADTRSGVTLRGNGLFRVDGGTVYANQIRTSIYGSTNIGGYIQNGGDVYVNGSNPGDTETSYYVFSLSYPGNVFQMSGGDLYITGANSRGLVWINSDPSQTSVSGGTVHIDVSTTNNDYTITSRAPFWNVNITRSVTSGTNRPVVTKGGSFTDTEGTTSLPDLPLYINSNLSISGTNSPTLQMGPSSAAPMDLFLNGGMTISTTGQYTHFENTTHFLGNTNSFLNIVGASKSFHNVIIDKAVDTRFAEIQTTSFTPAMDIQGSLFVEKGFLENNNRQVIVRGNVTNRSRIGSANSTGDILLQGISGEQQIFSQGGIFHGLRINNADGVTVVNDGITVRRRILFDNGLLTIGDHKLRMETTFAPFASTTAAKHVVCSGNPGAGGLEIFYHSGSQSTTFPIGISSESGSKYTPATVVVNGNFIDSGFVQIAPVDTLLPTADVSAGGAYLNYFWRLTHSEFENLPLVSHSFTYHNSDVIGMDTELESGRVLTEFPFERGVDDAPGTGHVNTTSKNIFYNGSDVAQNLTGTGTELVNANYSAGHADRFDGRPLVFFSKADNFSADWNDPGSWNKLDDFTGLPGVYDFHSSSIPDTNSFVPGPGSIVFIGFDVDNANRKPHSYAAPAGGIDAAEVRFTPLQDPSGNRLPRYNGPNPADITIRRPTLRLNSSAQLTNVQQISGEGTILMDADVNLSLSDISGFLSEDSSIVMLESTSNLFVNNLPSEIPNLFITANNNGSNNFSVQINSDVSIRGNLELAGNANLRLSNGSQGNITVGGDFIAAQYQANTAGAEVYFPQNGPPKLFRVQGDVKLTGQSAKIDLLGTSTTPPQPVLWTPEALTDAILWLDADDASKITNVSGNVSQWTNSMPGAYLAVQSDVNKRPIYQSGGLNGRSTVRFDGIDDFLEIAHDEVFNVSTGQDFELFTVTVPLQKNSRAIYSKGGVHNTDLGLYYWNESYRIRINGASFDAGTGTGNNQNANIGWVRRQGANGIVWNSSGGTTNVSGVSGAVVSNTKDVCIGALDEGIERFFDGHIGEVIFIKRALSTDERQRLEGYLAHKWGLTSTLPNGHPFKSTPPASNEDDTKSHQLELWGNIIQNITGPTAADGINLYRTTTFRRVDLSLRGPGNHTFQNTAGPAPDLWRMTVDKGFDLTSSFTWNSDVSVFGPSNVPDKSVNIVNGLLVFNHPSINLTLASGGGNYIIPGTAGLELNEGALLITGSDMGLVLDGSLEITGGNFEIGDTPGDDNYIEYSSNGTAKINVSGGSLEVGSQIRRGLTNTAGILDYRQSGGAVKVGVFDAPNTNRGVFEITNSGSRFDHTGGTLTFVRGVNSLATPSLLLLPTNSTVSGNAEIIIGNATSPSGGQITNFGIQSNVAINRLSISNASGYNPAARIQVEDLDINDFLSIDNGASLSCGSRNLFIKGDVINDGLLSSASGTVFFEHPVLGTVSGSGVFDLYDLTRQGGASGVTDVNVDLVVKNEFANDEGTMDFDIYQIEVKGDVFTDGVLNFDPGSDGLIFNGSGNQKLDQTNSGSSVIDVVTINNINGVSMTTGQNYEFIINENLRMVRGVFDLSGNLLELGANTLVSEINPFGETNMISTGGAFTNFGVRKFVSINSTDDVFIPLGIDRYMPVRLDFSAPGNSSGNTLSSYLIKLNVPEHPIVVEDAETPDPEIVDVNNVLGMYFSMDADNIGSGLRMDAEFQYDDQYMQVTAPYDDSDYIGVRVYSVTDAVFKFTGPDDVDEANNIIRFSFIDVGEGAIDGDYFAGIDNAVPNFIPAYTTADNGDVNAGLTTYTTPVPGGGAPSGARVNVVSNHVLRLNVDGVNLYRIDIAENATVEIDETSFHRLGIVTGTGTIKLNGTGSLPSGLYNDFFTCTGGKLIYEGGTGDDYEILSNLPVVRKVDVVGLGNIRISNNNVEICEDLTVNGPTLFTSGSSLLNVNGDIILNGGQINAGQGDILVENDLIMNGLSSFTAANFGNTTIEGNLLLGGSSYNFGSFNRRTRVKGDVIKTSGVITGGTSGAGLVMEGSIPQFIDGDFTGSSSIRNLEINNSTGVSLYSNVQILDTLKLTSGKLITGVDSMIVLQNHGVDVVPLGGSPSSYVDGPMQWVLNAASERIFPLGKNDRYRPLRLNNRSASNTWTAEYYDTLATVQPSIVSMDPFDPVLIKTVSIQEHWRVSTLNNGTTARVGLSWGENSAVAPASGDYNKLVVLGYNVNTDVWDSFEGANHTYNAGNSTGNFMSTLSAGFSERFFTLGSSDAINPLPVTFLHFRGSTNGTYHALNWATASETNNDYFALQRSVDGQFFQTIAMIEGAGNSNTTRHYDYVDKVAPHGRVYYRLQQVDFDGQTAFAPNIVTLYKEEVSTPLDFVIFPNPTRNGEVRLNISEFEAEMVLITITDLTGKTLDRQTLWVDEQGITQPFQCNFEPGIYLVSIIVDNQLRSKPLVISR